MGYLFEEYKLKILKIINIKGIGVLMFLMHLSLFFISFNSSLNNNSIFKLLTNIISIIMLTLGIGFCYCLASWILERKENLLNNRIVSIFDKYNFTIYLLNEPILLFILYKLKDKYIDPILLVSFCFIGSMLISILFAFFLGKTKYLKKAFGI
jgi:peptidoglycan/LPS O-acetylase OafA/YrhL